MARMRAPLTSGEESDQARACKLWVQLCCVQPVGCGDGATFVVQAPTQEEFVAGVLSIMPSTTALRARVAKLEAALTKITEGQMVGYEAQKIARGALPATEPTQTPP